MVLIRYHYTGDWSELSLVLGRPLEGLGRGAGQLYNEDRNGDDNEDGIDSENCKTQVVSARREIRASCWLMRGPTLSSTTTPMACKGTPGQSTRPPFGSTGETGGVLDHVKWWLLNRKSICDYNHNDNDPSIATENLEQMRIWLVQGFELGFVRCPVIHSCCETQNSNYTFSSSGTTSFPNSCHQCWRWVQGGVLNLNMISMSLSFLKRNTLITNHHCRIDSRIRSSISSTLSLPSMQQLKSIFDAMQSFAGLVVCRTPHVRRYPWTMNIAHWNKHDLNNRWRRNLSPLLQVLTTARLYFPGYRPVRRLGRTLGSQFEAKQRR